MPYRPCVPTQVDIEDVASQFSIKDGSNSRVGCGACPRSRSRHTAAKPDGSYDVIIIGAGCIGSAIARELSKTNASVLMIEAADDVTQGATKGNSGIIHAGFDDKPGSVRATYRWAVPTMAVLSMALLAMAALTMAVLAMAVLAMAILTMAVLY